MKVFKIILYFGLLLSLLLLILFLPTIIKIKDISCVNQYGYCSDLIISKLDNYKGKSLSVVKKSLRNLITSDPLISDFSFKFIFPDKLRIDLVEGKIKYAIQSQINNMYSLIDNKGIVVRIQDSNNLPYLISNENLKNVGEKVDDRNLFALELIYDMFTTYQIKSGVNINNSLEVQILNGIKVIFPLEGDKAALISSLNLIIERLNSDSKDSKIEQVKNIKLIDLRYKNPIIK